MAEHSKDRRATDPDHPDPVLDIVTKATSNALDRRRWSMFREAFVVGVIAALLIALPITLIARQDAVNNAAYNCGLLTSIAQIMGSGNPHDPALREGGFVSTDAELRRQQEINATKLAALRPGPLKRLLADPETIRLSNQSHALDVSTQRYWTMVLIPRLTELANASCPASSVSRGG